jgi:succinyl-CoA synthetase beta subunit
VHSVDHVTGFRRHQCVDLWRRTGVRGSQLVDLSYFTLRLWETFREVDGFMLEINPLAVDESGHLWAVGAMLDVDDAAIFRHPDFARVPVDAGPGWREPTIRERAVGEADRALVGGRVRYIELEGEIGLFVAGGGAGLMIHDLLIAFGGRPANHTDITPGRSPDKLSAVFDAIFTQPHVKSLLVCVNYLQMVRADVVVEALVRSIADHHVTTERFPIVVRVFGPGEGNARILASQVPGIRYLPHGTDIEEAVRLIVDLTSRV